MLFEDFQLSEDVQLAIKAAGYTEPTPIQQQAIPLILEGRDLIGSAQTGTGKTAAFALPILTRINKPGGTRVLIIEPTRELALQVEAAFRTFGRFSPLRVGVLYGGVGYGKQNEQLEKGMDVWVITPGRALDYLERGTLSLEGPGSRRAGRGRPAARHGFPAGHPPPARAMPARTGRRFCSPRRSRRRSRALRNGRCATRKPSPSACAVHRRKR